MVEYGQKLINFFLLFVVKTTILEWFLVKYSHGTLKANHASQVVDFEKCNG